HVVAKLSESSLACVVACEHEFSAMYFVSGMVIHEVAQKGHLSTLGSYSIFRVPDIASIANRFPRWPHKLCDPLCPCWGLCLRVKAGFMFKLRGDDGRAKP